MSAHSPDPHASAPVAAIDVGTNTALCLVARARADGSLETLEDVCLTPRLGAGFTAAGVLDPAAIERALAALRTFAGVIAAHGVAPERVRAVGTACLRRAHDGRAFAERARRETGIAVEILAESEEARLGERAIALAGAGDDALVVDVGGGSTEVACRELALRCSLPIGAVVASEACAANPQGAEAGWAELRTSIAPTVASLPAGCAAGRATWAIGGTAVNLGACAAGLARFDPRAVEGLRVTTAGVREWADAIGRAPRARRLEFPIEAERADILPAGLAILSGALERLGAEVVRISALGLRHGLARELLDRDRIDRDRIASDRSDSPGLRPAP